jgi:hypothetical protein
MNMHEEHLAEAEWHVVLGELMVTRRVMIVVRLRTVRVDPDLGAVVKLGNQIVRVKGTPKRLEGRSPAYEGTCIQDV